jgi:hypothetical protein
MGLVPRDFRSYEQGYLGAVAEPFNMPLIPESEWEGRIAEQEAKQSSLQHIFHRAGAEALDQNGQGYCWAYSSTGAAMLTRLKESQPYKRLSAHMVGCLVKGYQDQGGWNAESLQFIAQNGVASTEFWKEKSMGRDNDKPETRANAALHKITEWWDLSDRGDAVRAQLATCLLNNICCPVDFNWWGHSVLAVRLIKKDPFTIRILNSWRKDWGDQGFGDLEGSKAIPNGSCAPRSTRFADS